MARAKSIPACLDTKFFQKVTPRWVPPGTDPIAKEYHDAIQSLAEWVGPNWISNEETGFFTLRHILIRACDTWDSYDWARDKQLIAERRNDNRHLHDLEISYRRFTKALKRSEFSRKRKLLGLCLLTELCPEAEVKLNDEEALQAIDRALLSFTEYLKISDNSNARYGPLEYAKVPARLPDREVAIAISLADQITYWRRDGFSEGTLCCPHKPKLSKRLPWKAISEFATAQSVESQVSLDAHNVQQRVLSHLKSVALVHWS